MEILSHDFYNRDTVRVARDLLGRQIVRRWRGQDILCRITETEAYVGRVDKACHAYGYRRTARTEMLFSPPGHAYVYLIYGMYHCLNFVTEPEGEPCAVLIRCVRHVRREDRDIIAGNRFARKYEELTPYQRKQFLNGPGKLCLGLGITREQNGHPLFGGDLFVTEGEPVSDGAVIIGKRIGIDYAQEAADFPWRFTLGEES